MSKSLLKLAQQLVDYANEAIEIKKAGESAPQPKKELYQAQLSKILLSSQSNLIEYVGLLAETKKTRRTKAEKIKVRKSEIKKFARQQKEKETKKPEEFKVYKTNFYSQMANFFMEDLSFYLSKRYPDQNEDLTNELTLANIKILSKTYISIILFTTIISFPLITLISFLITFNILLSLPIGILGTILTFFTIYKYPTFEKSTRAKAIRQELVFGLIHMSAVASSGATPLKIFKLLVDSNEYKHLQTELERILNYVNIFGYNLTTSLKSVAMTTPSPDLRELLFGLASTIETGGGIKEYLQSKSDDALSKYKIDQKKYLEVIATYSEIYTGILIAAPLLFLVTLAILERISPNLGGVPIGTIASLSVFGALPLLNIIYLLIVETSKTEAT